MADAQRPIRIGLVGAGRNTRAKHIPGLQAIDGVEIDKKTNGPLSDEINKTSLPGIFVCGNSFKVYDIVDNVTKDSEEAGKLAAEYLQTCHSE